MNLDIVNNIVTVYRRTFSLATTKKPVMGKIASYPAYGARPRAEGESVVREVDERRLWHAMGEMVVLHEFVPSRTHVGVLTGV